MSPEETAAHVSIIKVAEIYIKKGAFDQAVEVLGEILASDPSNGAARQKLKEIEEKRRAPKAVAAPVAQKPKRSSDALGMMRAEDDEPIVDSPERAPASEQVVFAEPVSNMDFKAALQEIIGSVDGSIGAGLVGLDGLVIDQVSAREDFDIAVAGAEYATIIKNAIKASRDFGLGNTSEVLITTEKATMIMMVVSSQYFMTLALGHDGNLGRGRLELKKAIPKFEKALE